MECKYCSAEISNDTYFCPRCGKAVVLGEIKTEAMLTEYEKKMMDVIEKVNNVEHTEITWDVMADKYTRVMEKMNVLFSIPEFTADTRNPLVKRIDVFLEQCEKPEFHIAFVGTIKAGKSTLINALLGKNYASTSVTPETAVLTKFRHCEKENYVRIKFYSEDEWEILWNSISTRADVFLKEYETLQAESVKTKWVGHGEEYISVSEDEMEKEIEKWTSSKKAEHYFVKEVEIGLQNFKMPEEVVFVDTPGLDDAVKYRSDVTRQYIDRANAVFVCVKSDALTGQEVNILYRVFSNTSYNPEKVYVIGTQWDSLNNPSKDWKQQKENWVKYLCGKEAYGSKELAQRNITYAAAYVNNLARDYEILDEDERWSLQYIGFKFRIKELESELTDLIDLSNISEIDRHIQQDLIIKYKQYLHTDIEESYLDIKKELKEYFDEIQKNQKEIIETSSKSIEEIREKFEQTKEDLKKVQKYQEQLKNTLKLVQEDTKKRIDNLSEQLKEMV